MAKPRASQPRASSSASGRRSAGARDSAGPAKPGKPGGKPASPKIGVRSGGKPAGGKPAGGKPAGGKAGGGKPSSRRGSSKTQPFAPNEREQQEGVRLQKFIASAGAASRRKAEELIERGAVTVNGQVVRELGTRVFPGRDRVTVHGEPLTAEDKVYFVLNKPDQVVSSAGGSVDDRGRPTVLSLMHGIPQRLYPVGRLDYHSRGVLILTNDGELAAALTHPRHGVVKTYHVKFQGKLTSEEEDLLREGVELDDGAITRPLAELFAFRETDANAWYQIGLTEGLNRQIRRMGEAIGHPVLKLIRVAIGDITADGLAEGEYRPLSPTEVGQLLASVKLEPTKRVSATPAQPRSRPAGGSATERKPAAKPAGAARARPGKPPSKPLGKPAARGGAGPAGKPASKPASKSGSGAGRAKPSSSAGGRTRSERSGARSGPSSGARPGAPSKARTRK